MGTIFPQDKLTPPQQPFVNQWVDDIPAEEVRRELGEPPYQFEEGVDTKTLYGCRFEKPLEKKTAQDRVDQLFTWKTWFKRLFISPPRAFWHRERYIDYPRYMTSGMIFPILVRKTWRRFASLFRKRK